MPTIMALPYLFLKIMKIIGCSANMDSLAKVLDFVIHEKQQHRTAFPIFLESSQSVVLVFIKATFGCSEHVQKTEVGLSLIHI